MLTRHPRALVILCLVLLSATARAQVTTSPAPRERELAQTIRQAGFDCRAVENIAVVPNPDPAFETLRPEVATCNNGKKYLIVKSGRGGMNARPIVRPLPADA
jgi:uroporphyrinogen-III synthase